MNNPLPQRHGNPRRITRALALGLALFAQANLANAATPPAPAETSVDPAIKPGDDFFAYANGEWLKATAIPAGKSRWGARDEISARTKQQVAAVITSAGANPAGSAGRKLADFHTAYLNVAAIEAQGLAPLTPLLKSVAEVQDRIALARWLGGHLRADVDPLNWGVFDSAHLFGLSVEYGIHGEKSPFAYLLQGGLGLSGREAYLGDTAETRSLRLKYRDYIARLLGLAGIDRALPRADAVLTLETEIARSHATEQESAKESNADHHWAQEDFPKQAPGLDWPVFFAAAGLGKQPDIVVWQPGAIKGAAALVAAQPLAAWQDYLRFHVIDDFADVLPRAFADAAAAFRATAQDQRAQRAIDETSKALPDAVGQIYVARYFPATTKAKLQEIAGRVIEALGQRVQAVTWLSPTGKAKARAKLQTLYLGAGYPAHWPDDSHLLIEPGDAAGNRQRVREWNYQNALAKLDQPVDRHEWAQAAQAPVALLNFLQNSCAFSAALLQAPKFDPTASDAANYGAVGAIFGHEMSHFIDTLGADYDEQGATNHWWTKEERAQFDAACQPLIEQYSGYRAFPDLAINGKLTLGENVADLGGLSAAFDAYRRTLGHRTEDKQYLREQDRQFFIGYAQAWRSKLSESALREQAKSNDHAPERFRISTVRNIDAWYDAFDVQPGQALFLEPKARVRVW